MHLYCIMLMVWFPDTTIHILKKYAAFYPKGSWCESLQWKHFRECWALIKPMLGRFGLECSFVPKQLCKLIISLHKSTQSFIIQSRKYDRAQWKFINFHRLKHDMVICEHWRWWKVDLFLLDGANVAFTPSFQFLGQVNDCRLCNFRFIK